MIRSAENVGISILFAIVMVLLAAGCQNPSNGNNVPRKDWTLTLSDTELIASDGNSDDEFGYSVGISGDSALVGARYGDNNESGSGNFYFFERSTDGWSQASIINLSDVIADDRLGHSVAISGDTAIVGCPKGEGDVAGAGSAYVFRQDSGSWSLEQKIYADDGAADDWFGNSVAVSGDTIIVGAPYDDEGAESTGSVYVFQRESGAWSQVQKLTVSDGALGDYFGVAVAVSGDTAVAGAFNRNAGAIKTGAVYVLQRDTAVWEISQILSADDAEANDLFGYSVAISGDYAAFGAPSSDDPYSNSGSAYIFRRVSGTWSQAQKLLPSDGALHDSFGNSVAISDDTAVIGTPSHDSPVAGSGAIYIFQRYSGNWNETRKIEEASGEGNVYSGYSVAISDDTIIAGARQGVSEGVHTGSSSIFE